MNKPNALGGKLSFLVFVPESARFDQRWRVNRSRVVPGTVPMA
jgi:hypothetical protein